MSDEELNPVATLFDLPSYQRRLRHVRNITLRNLQCKSYQGKDLTKLQTFFTLHTDAKLKEFYRSESIVGSLNPSWQSFNISRFEDEIDIQAKDFVVRIWITTDHEKREPRLLVDWSISFSGLVYFSDKLQQDKHKYGPNTIIVGMFDKYFVAPETVQAEGDQLVIDPSVSVRNSYTINSLSRIHTVLRAIQQMQGSVKRVHHSIEDRLLTSQEKTQKISSREDLLMRTSQLKSELEWQVGRYQHHRAVLDNYKKAHQEKNDELKTKFQELEMRRREHEEQQKMYFQTREKYIKENAQLLIRRKQLINELTTYIYPLSEKPNKNLCICGVHLPNSEDFHGVDDNQLSVALGYTSHLVMMMSQILDFPLRYPMDHEGSRSTITDHIHTKLSDKDKKFPLYLKGKEKFQFNYGVFLLNKNISQLRYYCGLGTQDLRLTLPNIKSMLEYRLGVKFDSLSLVRSLQSSKDHTGSVNSSDKDETIYSKTSGKESVRDPAEEALEHALKNGGLSSDTKHDNTNDLKKNIPINLKDLPVNKHHPEVLAVDEDIFKPSEDTFFKLKTTAFVDDSCGNSSCGSFSEQTNGMTLSSRNFSLSPSPVGSEGNSLTVTQSGNNNSNNSRISPQSCDLSTGEDTIARFDLRTSATTCDNDVEADKSTVGVDPSSLSLPKHTDISCDNL